MATHNGDQLCAYCYSNRLALEPGEDDPYYEHKALDVLDQLVVELGKTAYEAWWDLVFQPDADAFTWKQMMEAGQARLDNCVSSISLDQNPHEMEMCA